MRIGIDARLWNETGVGRYIRNLVWQLQEIDTKNSYTLFVTKGITKEDIKITNKNFTLIESDIRWHSVEEQLVFYKVLENQQLDLVHFPYFSVPILYTRPFVITIHDLIINHYPTGKASTLPLPIYYAKHFSYQLILKQAAKKAKKIITVSEATKGEIVDHLKVSADNIVVTYEGVDKSLVTTNKSAKGKYFLYVGNAYPHKNLERLINVFKILQDEKKDCKLLLVGKEDYFYTRLKGQIAQLHLEENVQLVGKVSDQELAGLYKGALGLITPSLMEGFGLPGLEAMQQKTLVLAANIPVYKEVYGDAAAYFDPLDVSSMHATILKVLQSREKFDKQVDRGQQLVKQFSWEKMAKETLQIYESSIGI